MTLRSMQNAESEEKTNPLYVCLETCQPIILDPFCETPPETRHNSGLGGLQRFPDKE
jgi:hypothetical protein